MAFLVIMPERFEIGVIVVVQRYHENKVIPPVPGRDINTGTASPNASQWALMEEIYLEAPRSADFTERIKVINMCKIIIHWCYRTLIFFCRINHLLTKPIHRCDQSTSWCLKRSTKFDVIVTSHRINQYWRFQ